jgi:hypothetical protein
MEKNRKSVRVKDISFCFLGFLVWRVTLFIFAFLAVKIPLQNNFLGGGLANYLRAPYFWGWANFDGEHYLSIARLGYQPLTHFYFPAYPLIIKVLAYPWEKSLLNFVALGIAVSNILFVLALVGLIKLLSLDYKKSVWVYAILLILLFPTSFYFGSFYTESLFLFSVVWSFYFARKKKWLFSAIFGFVATATRIVGIILLPALVAEFLSQNRNSTKNKANLIFLFLFVPLGLIIYMIYLKITTGDALIFFHTINIFGSQRSASIIFLPRVYYRYIFKILPNLSWYWPVVFTTILEFSVATIFLISVLIGFWRLRISYWIYLAGGYFIPTFSGSFSSMPRYALVLFPAFILFAIYLNKSPKFIKAIVFLILFLSLGWSTVMFISGYWVS